MWKEEYFGTGGHGIHCWKCWVSLISAIAPSFKVEFCRTAGEREHAESEGMGSCLALMSVQEIEWLVKRPTC